MAATPPGSSGPSWPYGRATTRRRAPQSPRGCAGDASPPGPTGSLSSLQPVLCARPAAGGRPSRAGGRPAGHRRARRDPAANRTNRRATEPADNLNGPRCPPPWCPLQPPARQGGAVPPRWGIRSRAVADSGHGVGTAGATLRGGLRTLSAGRGAAASRRNIRQQAETVLWQARQTAVALGAAPLRREIELLAQRGRLRLEEPVDEAAIPPASSAAASLGLTQREAAVLALVAQGRTNRQIGETLFITSRTAGVHVSRILAKLGVTGRGEAAAVAHRLGLDKP